MKAYEYSALGLENLTLVERAEPRPGPREVQVRFHAASLNYRDLLFGLGSYNPNPRLPAIPGSDGAGEVTAVGEGVTRWKVGDRVCPSFMQAWVDGTLTPALQRSALGAGDRDGVLREFGVFSEEGLSAIPEHLSYEEAATLPCAALTAWNALVEVGGIKAGDTILTLGTGGVSLFALQLAKLHGARVIATSSSDAKLERARQLGADATINYAATPDWDKEVLRLTGKRGVDHVVEVGGAGTLPRSINAARFGGLVTVIGVLAQGGGLDPMRILMRGLRLQGVFVGSRRMFEDMARAVALAGLRPVVDQVFAFGEVPEALARLRSGSHFGKIVIRVDA
ncbi:zinc-dependent alcohol dehydrogenase family protein [Mesoterricola silvestris]|uniref:NADPH:quinone oxidoreductase n=1 Tax=Mesoterricola silvestris TaxID=2927979 RepID=A0AA48KBZ2_9BACT|nr:NAD(P)-dependent alcohol dehydrogenase [Mesoterricola silvestris]BDU72983.1 NADPH:quinone oxidoreductase [Mesoterricola silvestris]